MKLKPMVFVLLLLLIKASGADVINGSKGLPHTKAAWVTDVGKLTVFVNTRFWGKVHQVESMQYDLPLAVTVWDVQGLFSINYGLGKHFELNITPIVYQDDQTDEGLVPYDTFIGLKIGSFGSRTNSLSYGMHLQARFPTSNKHNILFEPYSAGTAEFGFKGLVSYAADPLYPEDAFNLHANLGYHNHNDVGEFLRHARDPNSQVLYQSQQLLYALGLNIPTENFDYGIEWYGNAWLQQPPLAAESRENYLFMNAVITYKPYRWFQFFVSGEIRLNSDNDETVPPLMEREYLTDLPNYNSWRINIGSRFTLLPTSVFRTSERDILIQKAESRRELFEQIIKERRETESAEEELERIREERRKAERELERLRKILEGQSPQKQDLEEMRRQLEPKK
ncbi:hypothetical protein JXO59_05855 [candidate division KSB1 bacterium]|nr:hypothetical protein [candidate division KSB1 bacterium]